MSAVIVQISNARATPEARMPERMAPMTQPRHANAVDFFNDLIVDLKLKAMGRDPRKPLDDPLRLEEADHHLRQLESDRVPILWR
jgi:hypothetical protein